MSGAGRSSVAVAAVAAVLAVPLFPSPLARLLGGTGMALAVAGALARRTRTVNYGVGATLLAAGIAGAQGYGPASVLPSALLALLVWDNARFGVRLDRQLGPDADARTLALSHAALGTLFGAGTAATAVAVYWAAAGAVPTLGALALLVGALFLVVSFA
jgi:hypothetical protein